MRKKLSTLGDFKDFSESQIWRDIQSELLDMLDQVHIQLEDPWIGSEKFPLGITEKELHRLGGNAETLRRMGGILDIIMQDLEQESEEE